MRRLVTIRQVVDAEQLAAAVSRLLEDDIARNGMIEAAADYTAAQSGVVDKIVGALAPHLDRAAESTVPGPLEGSAYPMAARCPNSRC